MMTDNNYLRQQMLKQRKQLSQQQVAQASEQLISYLNAQNVYRQASCIGLYMPHDNEISPLSLFDNPDKQIYLPRLRTKEKAMDFLPYDKTLQPNRYGILEPPLSADGMIEKHQLDIIILPLVAFNCWGHRLGRGQGYYDRYLTPLPHEKHQPITIGIGYEFQRCDTLVIQPWDIRLDMIITEQQHYPIDDDRG